MGYVKFWFAIVPLRSLIRPPYLPRNWPHQRGGLWWEGEVNTLIVVTENIYGLIREDGICWEWPLREGLLCFAKLVRWGNLPILALVHIETVSFPSGNLHHCKPDLVPLIIAALYVCVCVKDKTHLIHIYLIRKVCDTAHLLLTCFCDLFFQWFYFS